MSHTHNKLTQLRGFTLVELLVVITIVAMLMAFLLPTLAKARESSNNVKCLSNLRQIGLGVWAYVNEANGRCPPLQDTTSTSNAMWAPRLVKTGIIQAPNDGDTNSVFMCPSGTLLPIATGSLGTDPASQTTDVGFGLLEGDLISGSNYRQFAVNYAVNGTATSGLSSWDPSRPVSEYFPFVFWSKTTTNPKAISANMNNVNFPGRVAMVFDGLWAHNQKGVRFTLRHNPGSDPTTNTVFLDGHARPLLRADIPRTSDNLNSGTVLKTDGSGKWAISLIVRSIP